jgi:hypothetical protein
MDDIDELIAKQLEVILEKYRELTESEENEAEYRDIAEGGYQGEDSDSDYYIPSRVCPHCKGDIRIRNPSGYCDHLHYPENCKTCQDMLEGKHLEHDIIKDEDFEI